MLAAVASALSYPLNASLLLAACGVIAILLRLRRTGTGLFAMAFLWTLLWSVPAASDGLRNSLEGQHAVVQEESLPAADAIVVLGGATRYRWLQRENVDPWELGGSRLAAGARAWLSGRAPIVILTGGRGGRDASEAARMKTAIQRLGVPASVLVLEERSRNTEDNAANTARLAHQLGVRRILLVTSALHMPRAALLFRRQGFDVTPVPVPEGGHRETWRERWLPSPHALWRSGRALKEYVALMALHLETTTLPQDLDVRAGR